MFPNQWQAGLMWYLPEKNLKLVDLVHYLAFIWPPSILSTQLDKSVYFLLGETVPNMGNIENYVIV